MGEREASADPKLVVGLIILLVGIALYLSGIQPLSIFALIGFAPIGLVLAIVGMRPRARGITLIGTGIAMCIIFVPVILDRIPWSDVATILIAMVSLLVSSAFIIPGIILLKYQRMVALGLFPCLLVCLTIFYALVFMGVFWTLGNLDPSAYRTFFYDHLPESLGIGFGLGLVSAIFGFLYGFSVKK